MDECRPGGRLWELYADGRAPRMLADNLPLPNALRLGPDGNIYFPVLGENAIWRIPVAGGRPNRSPRTLDFPPRSKSTARAKSSLPRDAPARF